MYRKVESVVQLLDAFESKPFFDFGMQSNTGIMSPISVQLLDISDTQNAPSSPH